MATHIPSVDYVLQYKLWSCIEITNKNKFYDSCWEYNGKRTSFGYGQFSHRKATYLTHRLAYMLAHGLKDLPATTTIRHKCDNPACCNPLHLETGSVQDNNLDMLLRGRNPKADTHGMSVVTSQIVREMRWLHGEQGAQHPDTIYIALHRRYGVSNSVARQACLHQTWNSVADDFDTLEKPALLTAEELQQAQNTAAEGNHGSSELDPSIIQRIRALRALGASLTLLRDKFGIAEGAISRICNRRTWANIADAPASDVLTPDEIAEAEADRVNSGQRVGETHPAARLTALQVREIRWLVADATSKSSKRPYGLLAKLQPRYPELTEPMLRQITARISWSSLPDDFDTLEKPEPL